MKADTRQLAQVTEPTDLRSASWRLFEANDPNAPLYRARMIRTVLDFTPFSMAANLLNALIVAVAFADSVNPVIGVVWLCTMALLINRAMTAWWRSRDIPLRRASERGLTRATNVAFVQGVAWGLVPLVLFSGASPGEQLLIAVVTTGMLCAGAFVLAAIRRAAVVYCVTLGAFSASTIFFSDIEVAGFLGLLLLTYTAIIIGAIFNLSTTIVSRLIAEAQAENQRHVIGLLLSDFEEHASDILWEIDEHLALRHASPRLLEMLGLAEHAIDALPFADLLRRKAFADREGSNGLEQLEDCLSGEKPFRDIGLKLSLEGAVRWWTVTAKPLTNETGHVMGWRGVLADVTETRDTHESLVRLAHHCSLTDLANRHYFVMRLSDDLRHLSDQRHLAVLYIDLDDFKKVNDSFGHSVGDRLLKNIANRLQETVRQDDLVARLGGDEFAVMLHDVQDESQALSYAKRLIDFVEPAYRVDDKVMPVGMSIGVALAPLHGKKPDELMRAADLAMYAAKAEGKGTVCVFSPAMGEQNRRRRLLEAGLQDAMKHDQLHLVYQPQVNIETGEVTSVEALARWEHPSLGTVAPTEFIPIAEETGQIEAIGRWILKRACLQAREWPEQIGLSVNVSTAQAVTDTLIESVQDALNQSGLAVERLELEITESIFLSDNPTSLRLLHSLRDLGVQVAMDDFGVGYSSLAYLRKFPFSSLKIDRAFTHEVVTSEQSRAIIRAIIGLARSMGMTIIAEGVERPEQVRILKRLGADCAQGFLFAVPVSADSVNATLDQWQPERHRTIPGSSIEGLVRDHLTGEA
ncbi:MAG: putative bifunctional diguanylate cyclase/phosphodiesterase [Burkholderiaceae bacterium]